MEIQQKYLTPNPYSRAGEPLEVVRGIVIHWVGNPSSSAQHNRDYFESLKDCKKNEQGNTLYASSHYIVGLRGEIIACMPEDEIAYHAKSANKDHLGIEVCHPDWEGKFSPVTYRSLVDLTAWLCERYRLNPMVDVIRHYDVTGKDCPRYYVNHEEAWEQLKEDVSRQVFITESPAQLIQVEINGGIRTVKAIKEAGHYYVKLRDLSDEKINVDYDGMRKMPVLKVK